MLLFNDQPGVRIYNDRGQCTRNTQQHTIHNTSGYLIFKHQYNDTSACFSSQSDLDQVSLRFSVIRDKKEFIKFMQEQRSVGHTMLLHAEGGRGDGGGLTIVGVQQRQGALSAPIHPSLREEPRKTERRRTGNECEKRCVSNREVLKGYNQEIFRAVQEVRDQCH